MKTIRPKMLTKHKLGISACCATFMVAAFAFAPGNLPAHAAQSVMKGEAKNGKLIPIVKPSWRNEQKIGPVHMPQTGSVELRSNGAPLTNVSFAFASTAAMDASLRRIEDFSSKSLVTKISYGAPQLYNPQLNVADKNVLRNLRDEAWSGFYWFEDGSNGPYRRGSAPDLNAKLYTNSRTRLDASGGWFDAGDYGKYSINTAHSVGLILLSGMLAPDAMNHHFTMGSYGAARNWKSLSLVPLRWLLKMQRADGAVYHKLAAKKFPPMSLRPDREKATKWVMPVSSTATAEFAGVMALAAKVFANSPFVGDRFRLASAKAQRWLSANSGLRMVKAKYGLSPYGGPYTDHDDGDERFFAAAAGYLLGLDSISAGGIETMLARRSLLLRKRQKPMDWQNNDLLALWTLKLAAKKLPPSISNHVDLLLKLTAERTLQNKQLSPLKVAHADSTQLPWGSNGVLAGAGWHWLLWAKTSNQQKFATAALDQINWFVGRNPLNKVFLTGSGKNRVKAPHFRPYTSRAIGLPNGLLAGGPNSVEDAGDKPLRRLKNKAPWLRYADNKQSYASNEVAINWQAAWATYLSLALDAR